MPQVQLVQVESDVAAKSANSRRAPSIRKMTARRLQTAPLTWGATGAFPVVFASHLPDTYPHKFWIVSLAGPFAVIIAMLGIYLKHQYQYLSLRRVEKWLIKRINDPKTPPEVVEKLRQRLIEVCIMETEVIFGHATNPMA